jgi:tocopherol cyclase
MCFEKLAGPSGKGCREITVFDIKRTDISFLMILAKIKAVFNPEQFQGLGKQRKYFEGWYFKVIDQTEKWAFSFIPGIAMDESGEKHAFVQVLDGKKKSSQYHTFNPAEFKSTPGVFRISIGDNYFSAESAHIDLPGVKGDLKFTGVTPWPKHWYSPGIMGPYAFVPMMECYHGIVSMDHAITGNLAVNNELIDFENGRGYIEKDWGRSFPSAYIWLQSNHFREQGISLKVSVAKIPWLGSSFVGFIAGLWLHDHLVQFTTYNRSILVKTRIDSNTVEIILKNKQYCLEIIARRDSATSLVSPIRGLMEGRIEESMSSIIKVHLSEIQTGLTLFRGTGRNAGLEVAGKIEEILVY